jgi:hypothetical protein
MTSLKKLALNQHVKKCHTFHKNSPPIPHTPNPHSTKQARVCYSTPMDLHRRFSLILLLFLFAPIARKDAEESVQDLRIRELQLVIRSLREENRQLRERNDLLAEELIRFRRRFEEFQRAQIPDTEPEKEAPPPLPGKEILYVNPNWHYLLVAGGTAHNLVVAQEGRIMRDNAEIGRARITATKERQSVADIDLESLGDRGQYPRAGDRILFMAPPPTDETD